MNGISADSNITDNEHDIDSIDSYIIYDPDQLQHQVFDIAWYINAKALTYADSVQLQTTYMPNSGYTKFMQSLNEKQQEFCTNIMHAAETPREK